MEKQKQLLQTLNQTNQVQIKQKKDDHQTL